MGDNRYHAILDGKKCFAVCPSDMAVVLAALDAKVTVAGGEGKRVVPIMDFYQIMGPALKSNEMVSGVEVPFPTDPVDQAFLKFTVKHAPDFAIVSVATVLRMADDVCEDARIVFRAISGKDEQD